MKKLYYFAKRFLSECIHEREIRSGKFKVNQLKAEIIRYVHSIEKGLAISNPRPGFGVEKIKKILSLTNEYMLLSNDHEIVWLATDAIKAYREFQKSVGYHSEELEKLYKESEILEKKVSAHTGVYGGIKIYSKNEMKCSAESLENLFHTRHSIREFSGEDVPEETICRAIKLAQCAPSACNRQAVKVYNIKADEYIKVIGGMEGVGGFAHEVSRFLLICGVESAYSRGEKYQFVVTASMFAAYLSLALHGLGVGVCTIQRPLFPDRNFRHLREVYKIPSDEQCVVLLGIGMLKEETKVPISKRLAIPKIYKKIN